MLYPEFGEKGKCVFKTLTNTGEESRWCSLTKEDKQEILKESILGQVVDSKVPVKVLFQPIEHVQAGGERYKCFKCDEGEDKLQSDIFYFMVDVYCTLISKYIKNTRWTNFNRSTPAVAIMMENPYKYVSDPLVSKEGNSKEGLEIQLGRLGIKCTVQEKKHEGKEPIHFIYSSVNTGDVYWSITDCKWKEDNTPTIYFKNFELLETAHSPYIEPSSLIDLYPNLYKDENAWNLCKNTFNVDIQNLFRNMHTEEWEKYKKTLYRPSINGFINQPGIKKEWEEFFEKMQKFNSDNVRTLQKEEWGRIISDKFYLTDDEKEFTHKNISLFVSELIRLLSSHYKIHIQPKREYTLWCFDKVLSVLDKSTHARAVKCNLVHKYSMDREDTTKNIPVIVVYPWKGEEAFRGLLSELQSAFQEYDHECIGLDIMPRFNVKVSELIYYARGDGDLKKELQQNGVLDYYFDKNKNYGELN